MDAIRSIMEKLRDVAPERVCITAKAALPIKEEERQRLEQLFGRSARRKSACCIA